MRAHARAHAVNNAHAHIPVYRMPLDPRRAGSAKQPLLGEQGRDVLYLFNALMKYQRVALLEHSVFDAASATMLAGGAVADTTRDGEGSNGNEESTKRFLSFFANAEVIIPCTWIAIA